TTKKVELVNKIDKSIIGGIKVVIHDRVYDDSLKNKLDSLKSGLLQRKVTNYEN
ncbi:MAG: F0F1 ATP synthase subunit delta, partial [Bacilli bacterium]